MIEQKGLWDIGGPGARDRQGERVGWEGRFGPKQARDFRTKVAFGKFFDLIKTSGWVQGRCTMTILANVIPE